MIAMAEVWEQLRGEAMDLGIDVSDRDDVVVLAVAGQLDVLTAPQLLECLVHSVKKGRCRVVVDLERVDFVDSTGLGVLVGCLRRMRTHGGCLALSCRREGILSLFGFSGSA